MSCPFENHFTPQMKFGCGCSASTPSFMMKNPDVPTPPTSTSLTKFGGGHKVSRKRRVRRSEYELPKKQRTPRQTSPSTKSYCNCVAKAASGQTPKCLAAIANGKNASSVKGCINPFGACGSIENRGDCSTWYNFHSLPAEYKAKTHGNSVSKVIHDACVKIGKMKK